VKRFPGFFRAFYAMRRSNRLRRSVRLSVLRDHILVAPRSEEIGDARTVIPADRLRPGANSRDGSARLHPIV
jgi:hypothetical protein